MMTSSESCSVTPSHGNPYAELGVVDCVTSSRFPIKLPLEWCELLAPASHGSIVLTSCCCCRNTSSVWESFIAIYLS